MYAILECAMPHSCGRATGQAELIELRRYAIYASACTTYFLHLNQPGSAITDPHVALFPLACPGGAVMSTLAPSSS